MRKLLVRHTAILPVLALFVWLAWSDSNRVGATADEMIHVTAGLYYNQTGDYRFQPENGNLPQRLYALPWMLADAPLPARSGPDWAEADVWALAEKLLIETQDRSFDLHRQSRLIGALAGALVLVVIYAWIHSVLGAPAAWLSLCLAAFCPTLVAHSGLTTTDVWGALGALLATCAWWRLCHRVTPGRVAAAGLAAGFFALCKFNCVLFVPVAAALVALRLLRRAPLPCAAVGRVRWLRGWRRIPALAAGGTLAALIAVAAIWAAYGFRYEASTASGVRFVNEWDDILIKEERHVGMHLIGDESDAHRMQLRSGVLQKGVAWARDEKLLPEAWLFGLAYVGMHSQYRHSYLAGEYTTTGWRSYFPVAFVLKTPPGGFLALAAGAVAWCVMARRSRPAWRLAAPLALAGALAAAAINSRINIGIRHVLPVILVLWMTAGAVFLVRRPRLRLILAGLAATGALAQAVATIRAYPHALTYFSPVAGDAPDRWLVDSNLDWGQGLPELKRWLDVHADGRPVYLSYFGTDLPARHGIAVTRFADHIFDFGPKTLPVELKSGWYCFGPTQFRRVYTPVRGPWTNERERHYQRIMAKVTELASGEPDANAGLSYDALMMLLKDFEMLRLARLTLYLEGRPPDHRLPGGVMVYKLDDRDLEIALYRPLSSLIAALNHRRATSPADDAPSR